MAAGTEPVSTKKLAKLRALWGGYCLHHSLAHDPVEYAIDLRDLWDLTELRHPSDVWTTDRQYMAYAFFMAQNLDCST